MSYHSAALAADLARAFEVAATPPLEWRGGSLEIQSCLDAEIMLAGPAETSKAQPDDAIVYCPSGPRKIGDLKIGDEVLNPDGWTGVVTGVFPRGAESVYRLEFSDGSSAESTLDHLWLAQVCNGSDEWSERVMTLSEIVSRYDTWAGADRRKRVAIPLTKPAAFAPKPTRIDPYVLGVLLGDGHFRPGAVLLSAGDEEILARVRAGLGTRYELRWNSGYDYRVKAVGFRPKRKSKAKPGGFHWNGHSYVATGRRPGGASGSKYLGSFDTSAAAEAAIVAYAPEAFSPADVSGDGIWNDLEAYGLGNARSATKFVPDDYLFNSEEVRWEILRGLMDTDGTVDKGGSASFSSISQRLAENVAWIVRSLGGIAKIKQRTMVNGGAVYHVTVGHGTPREMFHLTRKKARLPEVRRRPLRRFIQSIHPSRVSPVRCISVGGSRNLYLTDNLVVTHNTYACCYKLHQLALATPKAHGAIVRKVRVDMGPSVLRTWDRIVARDGGCTLMGGSHATAYVYDNGTVIDVIGIDKAGKVLSAEFDWVYVNQAEQLTHEDWATIASRCTGRGAVTKNPQIFGDCNPGPPTHWILHRKSLRKLYSFHTDNPSLYDKDGNITDQGRRTMESLENLPGVLRDRLLLGKWVQAEGVVYPEFDRGVNLVSLDDLAARGFIPMDSTALPRWWRRFASIDFGFTDPFVWHCWAVDGDGRMYLEHEVYRTGVLVEDHARAIKAFCEERKLDITATYADHARNERGTWERHFGAATILANKDIDIGLQKVRARLRKAGDGRPRLYVLADSIKEVDESLAKLHRPTRLVEEFEVYAYPKGADGLPLREKPIDKDNHACLSAETLVTTRRGDVPIVDASTSDEVLTRGGYRRILAAGMTMASADVLTLTLESGATLTGTGNHPVWVRGGWLRMDAVRYGDILTEWRKSEPVATSSCSTGSGSEGIRTPNPPPIETTSRRGLMTACAALAGFMKRFGSLFTGRSRAGKKSIMQTGTLSTTIRATSCVSPNASTSRGIESTRARSRGKRSPTSPPYDRSLPNGTLLSPGSNGIGSTVVTSWRSAGNDRSGASAAATGSEPRQGVGPGSAQAPANQLGGGQAGSIVRTAGAPDAVPSSSPTDIRSSSSTRLRVVSVRVEPTKRAVFNLTIDGEPEFFANGILVHNCDSARYAVMSQDFADEPANIEDYEPEIERPFAGERTSFR